MKELTAHQIAAALAGHPGAPWPELRLLIIFQSEAGDRVAIDPSTIGAPLSKAA
jgi:hypothetical protein